jgi:hypothetical protein
MPLLRPGSALAHLCRVPPGPWALPSRAGTGDGEDFFVFPDQSGGGWTRERVLLEDTGPMDEDAASQSAAVVYIGFGQVMHKFQLIEMNLWSVKALHFKSGIQVHQAFAKLASWDTKAVLGGLIEELSEQPHWPDHMVERLRAAARVRNYLTHRFLREFFVAEENEENYGRGIEQLVAWSEMVDELDADLEAHVAHLAGEDIDEETRIELAKLMPKTWPLGLDDTSADGSTSI